MEDNTLVLNRINVHGVMYPSTDDVGKNVYLDLSLFGKDRVQVKITQVSDSYVTYEIPRDIDLSEIKEQIYETRKKIVSIQSI